MPKWSGPSKYDAGSIRPTYFGRSAGFGFFPEAAVDEHSSAENA